MSQEQEAGSDPVTSGNKPTAAQQSVSQQTAEPELSKVNAPSSGTNASSSEKDASSLSRSSGRGSLFQWGIRNWLLLALIASSGIAYAWPGSAGWNPFQLPSTGIRWLVVVTMFCLGLTVRLEELHELKHHPFAVLQGVLLQCTLMPLLAWLAVQALNLEGALAQGVIVVGCVPGAMASNVLTMTARGNVSFSISLTTVATLLSPLSVPIALSFIGGVGAGEAKLDGWQQSVVLLQTVWLPVLVGFGLKSALPVLGDPAQRIAPWLASLALLWIIASVVAGNRERLAQIEAVMLIALLLINVLGYVGGYLTGWFSKLPGSMGRGLTLEVGMQNAGLGTFLAAELFGSDSLAQIPTAAYTFGCMLTGTMLATWWAQTTEGESHSTLGAS